MDLAGQDGNHLHESSNRPNRSRACALSGLNGLRFYDLRTSAARDMDRAAIPRATIRRIIGHETDAMSNRYRIVDQRDIREAGQKAEQYLKEQSASSPMSDKDPEN